jgi:hypothetical protein
MSVLTDTISKTTKGKLTMDYYDEIYLDIFEEFGEEAVSDVSYAKQLQQQRKAN